MKGKFIRPVIKVWCLPHMSEERLNELHREIVAAMIGIPKLGLENENDMTCLFPPDSMEKGLGNEIIIEITGIPLTLGVNKEIHRLIAGIIGKTVKVLFLEARVDCHVLSFDPKRQTFWSSEE